MKTHSEREAPDESRSSFFANFPGHWSHFNQERRYLLTVVVGQNTYRQIFQPIEIVPPGLNHCEERTKTKIYNVTLMLIIFLFSFGSVDICNTVLRRVLER